MSFLKLTRGKRHERHLLTVVENSLAKRIVKTPNMLVIRMESPHVSQSSETMNVEEILSDNGDAEDGVAQEIEFGYNSDKPARSASNKKSRSEPTGDKVAVAAAAAAESAAEEARKAVHAVAAARFVEMPVEQNELTLQVLKISKGRLTLRIDFNEDAEDDSDEEDSDDGNDRVSTIGSERSLSGENANLNLMVQAAEVAKRVAIKAQWAKDFGVVMRNLRPTIDDVILSPRASAANRKLAASSKGSLQEPRSGSSRRRLLTFDGDMRGLQSSASLNSRGSDCECVERGLGGGGGRERERDRDGEKESECSMNHLLWH